MLDTVDIFWNDVVVCNHAVSSDIYDGSYFVPSNLRRTFQNDITKGKAINKEIFSR